MKVIDHAGNSIKVGRLLRWQPSQRNGPGDYYVKVIDIVNPTMDEPGKVVFALTFGIKQLSKKEESEHVAIGFPDFVTVFDPEEELRAEAALAKAMSAR
jgi:hypothetical protein